MQVYWPRHRIWFSFRIFIYSYGIGFDSRLESSFIDGSFGKNIIIFGADLNSSVHVDNKGKDILILSEGPTKGLDDTTLTTEAKYPIWFYKIRKKICIMYAL